MEYSGSCLISFGDGAVGEICSVGPLGSGLEGSWVNKCPRADRTATNSGTHS